MENLYVVIFRANGRLNAFGAQADKDSVLNDFMARIGAPIVKVYEIPVEEDVTVEVPVDTLPAITKSGASKLG